MGDVAASVDAFMAAVREVAGERWLGPERAPVSEDVMATLEKKYTLTDEHKAWLREFGGKFQENRMPAENGTKLDVISAKRLPELHDFLVSNAAQQNETFNPNYLPFANSGRDYLVVDARSSAVSFIATDSDYRHTVAQSISGFFDSWANRIKSGDILFSRNDDNADWEMWTIASLDTRVKMKLIDDLTQFASFPAFEKVAESGKPLFNSLVASKKIELVEPGAIPAAKSLFGLGMVARAKLPEVRHELAEIALMWLEDDTAIDEIFATTEEVAK